jgi:Mitochondrial carrier protein
MDNDSSKGKRKGVMSTNNVREQDDSTTTTTDHSIASRVSTANTTTTNNTTVQTNNTKTQIPILLYPQWHNFVAGGVAGLFSRIIAAPLDLIRIRRQLHHNYTTTPTVTYPSESIWNSWKRIVQNEGGISALYRGNMAAMYLWVTYSAVQFSIYTSTKDKIQNYLSFDGSNDLNTTTTTNSSKATKIIVSFCSGAIAGLGATIVTYPFDVCRTTFSAYGLTSVALATTTDTSTSIISQPKTTPITIADAGAALTQPHTTGTNQPRIVRSSSPLLPLPLSSLYEPPLFPSSTSNVTSTKPIHSTIPMSSTISSSTQPPTVPITANQHMVQPQQLQLPRTFLQFVQQMYQLQGIRGFYAGVTPALIQIIPYMGCNFAIYDYLTTTAASSETIESNGGVISIGLSAYAGSISGAVSKIIVYPLDTVKRRLQAQAFFSSSTVWNNINSHSDQSHDHTYRHRNYSGMWDCIQTIARDEGFMAFYRGIVPSVMKTAIATSLTFATFRWTQSTLQYMHDRFIRPTYEQPH